MKRAVILFCFLGACAALLGVAAWAESGISPRISEADAEKLVEARVHDFNLEKVTLSREREKPVYVVTGTSGNDPYVASVDAQAVRVVSIRKNGEAWYQWPGVVVVGHRGTTRSAPENTVAALKKAIELGVSIVEIDVRETKDGHLILMHDRTVNRTTNGTGLVAELTLDAIKGLDAGSWFDAAFAGERVPTLEEALDAIEGKALPDLDFKAGDIGKLMAILEKRNLLDKVTLACATSEQYRAAQAAHKEIQIRPGMPGDASGFARLVEEFAPLVVNMEWRVAPGPLMCAAHLAGVKAFVPTLGLGGDTVAVLQDTIDAGADYILTDRPDLLVPLLKARGL